MTRAEWLKERSKGIGGSDAAAILGLSPWASQMDVWLDKTGRRPAEEPDPDREFMLDLGTQLEPVIATMYQKKTGRQLDKPYKDVVYHPKHAVLLGSPDRLVVGERRGVELKSENLFQDKFGDPGTDQVPEHYLIQCAHYMAITGYDAWDIALLHGGARFDIYTVHRDMELEEELIRQLTKWWNEHVIADIPPDLDGSAAWGLYLKQKHPSHILPITDADDRAAILARKLDGGKRMLDAIEAGCAAIENELKTIIGDYEGIRGDFGKITWKKTKDGVSTDWEAAFKNLVGTVTDWKPDTVANFLDAFTTPRPGVRRFLFTPSKELKNGATISGNHQGFALAAGGTLALPEPRNS